MTSLLSFLQPENDKPVRLVDLTALPNIIFATTAFILLWSWTKRYVSASGPFLEAKTLQTVNNNLYSVFSLCLGGAILWSVYLSSGWGGDLGRVLEGLQLGEKCREIYHFSKFYEYIDVILLVAGHRGGDGGGGVGSHMAFHHLSMPFLTYFRVLRCSQWQLFATLNCLHHFLMYAYFGGASVLKPVLHYTQYLQLGGGIALDVYYFIQHGMNENADEATGRAACVLLLLRYAQLYQAEYKATKVKGGQVGSGKEDGTKNQSKSSTGKGEQKEKKKKTK